MQTSKMPEKPKAKRRSYRAPTLTRYGDIRDITRSVGNMGNSDGGSPPMHKTSP